ncbi:STAS domain-containing protein [Phenylobacterium sp. LjRoot225]|uniref:STAS domain-containing protein n=1 Tax=Phenylobacterium sp. LjRoot225 TaxID=3342285 RepID=UPI003ECDCBC9
MQIDNQNLDDVVRIALDGRLDTAGVGRIEMPFSAQVGAAAKPVIVDLTAVSFLASLAVRMFISTGRVLAARGGRMVLFGATPEVAEIIEVMGLGEIIPVVADESAALALIRG